MIPAIELQNRPGASSGMMPLGYNVRLALRPEVWLVVQLVETPCEAPFGQR